MGAGEDGPPDVVNDLLAGAALDEALRLADNGHFDGVADALVLDAVTVLVRLGDDLWVCAAEDGPCNGGDGREVEDSFPLGEEADSEDLAERSARPGDHAVRPR